jgi:hypothetical protein
MVNAIIFPPNDNTNSDKKTEKEGFNSGNQAGHGSVPFLEKTQGTLFRIAVDAFEILFFLFVVC